MSGVEEILSRILEARVVAIVRGIAPQDLRQVLTALSRSGIAAVEVALNSDFALESIEILRDEFSDRFVIGAGTVLDSVSARSAILAGAEFLLSPVLSPSVVETCVRYSKLPVPGVLSPSEVLEAHELGCVLVKVFPAAVVGLDTYASFVRFFRGFTSCPLGALGLTMPDSSLTAGPRRSGSDRSLSTRAGSQQDVLTESPRRRGCFDGWHFWVVGAELIETPGYEVTGW